ncbi:MAG: hypothetical protein LW875_08085 [Proteobacteria bacterium]|jgi:hypothetical protein|nr:hypothetical protein [Pseudomonadota bacterium]
MSTLEKLVVAFILVSGKLAWAQNSSSFSGLQSLSQPINFCTVRINSDDEIKLYKKYYETKGVRFIELTEFGSRIRPAKEVDPVTKLVKPEFDGDWFNNACKSGIKCDVLLISGHYGSGFSGPDTTGLSWTINDLERQACDNSCTGILNSPTKVKLFGCNTLAGKALGRTREEQLQAYIDHGYSPRVASEMLAMLYSDIGRTNKERMEFVFNGVPNLYGFVIKAPLGHQIANSLEKYIQSIPDLGEELRMSKAPKYVDTKMAALPRWMGFRMTSGLTPDSPTWNGFQKTCRLFTSKSNMSKKLDAVYELVNSPDRKKFLSAIAQFVLETNTISNWSAGDESRIRKISKIPGAREEFINSMHIMRDVSPYTYMQFLNAVRFFNWMKPEEIRAERVGFMQYKGGSPVTEVLSDDVCSTGAFFDIKHDEIPESWYNSVLGIKTIACLKSRDRRVYRRIIDFLLATPDRSLVPEVMQILKPLKNQVPVDAATRNGLKELGYAGLL